MSSPEINVERKGKAFKVLKRPTGSGEKLKVKREALVMLMLFNIALIMFILPSMGKHLDTDFKAIKSSMFIDKRKGGAMRESLVYSKEGQGSSPEREYTEHWENDPFYEYDELIHNRTDLFEVCSKPPEVRVSSASSYDWIVIGNETRVNEDITLMGSLVVGTGGNLTLINVTLYAYPRNGGRVQIIVRRDGRLNILNGSVITMHKDARGRFVFYVESGGILKMYRSELHRCGSRYHKEPGLVLYSDNVEINGCVISHNYYGIFCNQSSIIIRDCTIYKNEIGIGCCMSSSLITNCDIYGNYVGISCLYSNGTIVGCEIHDNDDGIWCRYSNITISFCRISNNWCGIAGTGALISNCTITENRWGLNVGAHCEVSYNIIRFNLYGIITSGLGPELHIIYNDIYDNYKMAIYSGAKINATYNYFGGVPNQDGDSIHNAIYEPYYTMPLEPVTPPFPFAPIVITEDCSWEGKITLTGPLVVRRGARLHINNANIDAGRFTIGVKKDAELYITDSEIYQLRRMWILSFASITSSMISSGSISFFDVEDAVVSDCVLIGCGIASYSSGVNISYCTFEGCGIGIRYRPSPIISNCVIRGVAHGSAISISCGWGGPSPYVTIINCNIIDNHGFYGIAALGAKVIMRGCIIAHSGGDAIHFRYCDVIMERCRIMNHYDGVYCRGSDVIMHKCTICGTGGWGRNCHGLYAERGSHIEARYCNFFHNWHSVYAADDSVVDAAYNYWGDPNGPKYTDERNPDMRDEVYGNVIYEPWLTEPVLDTAPPYLGIEAVYVRHYIKGRGEVLIELEVSDVMYVGGKKEWYSFVRIVTDNLYGAPALRDIELYVDGELYSHYNVSSKHFMWPRWPLKWRIYEHDYEDGTEHIVEIVLRDKIGVEARKELHFIIDNSPPSLVKLHVSRTYIRKGGIIEVRQSSYDEHSQIRMVKLFVNETLLCLWTQENETVPFLWNTSDLSEGHYELKLTAINRAWLESSTSLLIGIDMSPPIISSINYPCLLYTSPSPRDRG